MDGVTSRIHTYPARACDRIVLCCLSCLRIVTVLYSTLSYTIICTKLFLEFKGLLRVLWLALLT